MNIDEDAYKTNTEIEKESFGLDKSYISIKVTVWCSTKYINENAITRRSDNNLNILKPEKYENRYKDFFGQFIYEELSEKEINKKTDQMIEKLKRKHEEQLRKISS